MLTLGCYARFLLVSLEKGFSIGTAQFGKLLELFPKFITLRPESITFSRHLAVSYRSPERKPQLTVFSLLARSEPSFPEVSPEETFSSFLEGLSVFEVGLPFTVPLPPDHQLLVLTLRSISLLTFSTSVVMVLYLQCGDGEGDLGGRDGFVYTFSKRVQSWVAKINRVANSMCSVGKVT